MATFIINGDERSVDAARTVGELLEALALHERRVAVTVNGDIVRRQDRDSTPLAEGDRIEIIQMVGGG